MWPPLLFSVPLSVPPSLLVVACVWFRLLFVLVVVVVFRFWLGLGFRGFSPVLEVVATLVEAF